MRGNLSKISYEKVSKINPKLRFIDKKDDSPQNKNI
jgi:hypothetical protein